MSRVEVLARLKEDDALCLASENLAAQLEDLRRQTERVERAMMALDPAQRMVLELMCVRPQKGNMERLCAMLGCEKSSIYRRRDRALRQFTLALTGRAVPADNS